MTAHVRTLKPFAMPKGMNPRTWRQTIEKELNALFDKATALITALDVMDADSEDYEDGADDEPWLAWGDRGPQSFGSDFQDCELDEADYEDSGDENEPSLGWSAATDQNLAVRLGRERVDETVHRTGRPRRIHDAGGIEAGETGTELAGHGGKVTCKIDTIIVAAGHHPGGALQFEPGAERRRAGENGRGGLGVRQRQPCHDG